MARRTRKSTAKATAPRKSGLRHLPRLVLRWGLRIVGGMALLWFALILLFAVVNPPTNIYQWQESRRLGGIERDWVALEDIAPVMARAAVAAEDANFCLHWGFDMVAIRAALDAGGARGASTISQQVVKNVFLWHGRSWVRKGLEAVLTPVVELVWSKRRILEVYLNIAEFDEGVFGVGAAAPHYFKVAAADLTGRQASRLAAALPDPKGRNPARPSAFLQRRGAAILSGAETIAADGRADCFAP
jgi:monofunctional glycosyltransferase